MEELESAMEEKLQAMDSLEGELDSSALADTGVVQKKSRIKKGAIPRTYAPGHRNASASNVEGASGATSPLSQGTVGVEKGNGAAA